MDAEFSKMAWSRKWFPQENWSETPPPSGKSISVPKKAMKKTKKNGT
jgi:hypothetical protein